ncbi:MAG: hypothetical protein ACQETD_07330, partial [Pseudomonadota bacterium]
MSGKKQPAGLKRRFNGVRRRLLGGALAGVGVAALGHGRSGTAQEDDGFGDLKFPGDEPDHKVVYQFNHA